MTTLHKALHNNKKTYTANQIITERNITQPTLTEHNQTCENTT